MIQTICSILWSLLVRGGCLWALLFTLHKTYGWAYPSGIDCVVIAAMVYHLFYHPIIDSIAQRRE